MATSTDSSVYVLNSKNRSNYGGTAEIAIRRIRPSTLPPGKPPTAQIVMVAGRTIPARVSFDLLSNANDGHYSWAREIADRCQAEVWIMEVQCMGASNRVYAMSDFTNILKGEQIKAFGRVLYGPNWPYHLNDSDSEWQELDAVVDHVRSEAIKENPNWYSEGAGRVILIGYSAGAYVVGPYAMQNPGKVWALLLLAPIFPPNGPADLPRPFAAPDPSRTDRFYGAPMGVHTKKTIWPEPPVPQPQGCLPERNDYVIDDLWAAMMANERTPNLVPGQGEIALYPTRFWWGWNQKLVETNPQLGKEPLGGAPTSDIGIPVLIIAGTEDVLIRAKADSTDGRGPFSVDHLYRAIAGRGKAMMYDIECAGHNIVWQDPSRHKLHDLSIEWIRGFANYVGPVNSPAYTPVRLPHGGSGRYLVPRNGGPPQPWEGPATTSSSLRLYRDLRLSSP
ncbi:alpha/beta fold hydrolase [Micromonospora costi]|nr:alpha/beta fold hydrolase [Micromonospora costi]